MKMKLLTSVDNLLKSFPLLRAVPQVKEMLKDIENKKIWVLVDKGNVYVSENAEVQNEQKKV